MTSPTAKGPNGLFAKLAVILGEIGRVAKNGRNEFHGYDYVTEGDLVDQVRSKLAAKGIAYFFSVDAVSTRDMLDKEGKPVKGGPVTEIVASATFADSESGETFTVNGAGAGQDAGDKGVYKAITGAQKYVLMKTFMIATGDDPEADSKVDRAAAEEAKYAKEKSAAKPKAQAHGKKMTAQGVSMPDGMNKVFTKGPHTGREVGSLSKEEAEEFLKLVPADNSWAKLVKARLDYVNAFDALPPALQQAAAEFDTELAGK